MIASDTLLILGVGFGIKLSDEDIADIERLKFVAMATNFGSKIALNCRCVNDSDYSSWLWRGFEWSADRMHILRYPAPKGRCHGNHFLAFEQL